MTIHGAQAAPPSAPTCRLPLPLPPPPQARDWAWWGSHRWPARVEVHRACGWLVKASNRCLFQPGLSPAPLSPALPCPAVLHDYLACQPLAKLPRGGWRVDHQKDRHVDGAAGVCLRVNRVAGVTRHAALGQYGGSGSAAGSFIMVAACNEANKHRLRDPRRGALQFCPYQLHTFSWSSGGRTSMSTARPSSTSSKACTRWFKRGRREDERSLV